MPRRSDRGALVDQLAMSPQERMQSAAAPHNAMAEMKIEACRSDLTDRQIEQWAHPLADRLEAAGVLAGAGIDVQIGAA